MLYLGIDFSSFFFHFICVKQRTRQITSFVFQLGKNKKEKQHIMAYTVKRTKGFTGRITKILIAPLLNLCDNVLWKNPIMVYLMENSREIVFSFSNWKLQSLNCVI
jgi:hypothetical protein